jgi:hypothetical protein
MPTLWNNEFPGRVVDMRDYCAMCEREYGLEPNQVFAYEGMNFNVDGRPYLNGHIVVAQWLDRPFGPGSRFEVLANGTYDPEFFHGLPTVTQIRLGLNGRQEAIEELRRISQEAQDELTRAKMERDVNRRDRGRFLMKKHPDSRYARRMALGLY